MPIETENMKRSDQVGGMRIIAIIIIIATDVGEGWWVIYPAVWALLLAI